MLWATYNRSKRQNITAQGASMNSDEAEQMAAFQAVIDTGSFTAAGRKLGRDGSVVSRRVAALEARLGIRLLERSTRRVSATEAGMRFRNCIHEAMDILQAAEDEARSLAASPTGLLRMTLPLGFGRMWIAPRLPAFLKLYPGLRVEAIYTDRYVDLIAEGFDAGVRIGKLEDSRLVARHVATMRRLLCASPDYLKQRPMPSHANDLNRHECIGFIPMSTHPVWYLTRHGKRHAVRIDGRLVTDDIEAVIHAALAGTGIILATDWLVGRELHDGRLVQVLSDWTVGGDEAINVVRASNRHEPAKTRAFIDWLVTLFVEPPWLQS